MNGIVAGEPAGMVDATLSPIEVARLVTLEAVIDAGLRTFVHVGHALIEIRDNRLYRETHRVFEDYCRERWGMSSEYARLNMRAAEVISNLQQTPTIVGVLPATESQARPLTVLEPDDQREAWRITVETAPSGKVTAAHVQATVNQYRATVDIDDDDIQVDGCWNCRHRIAVYGGDDLDVCALLQRTLRPDTYPEGYTPCHMNDWQSKEVETLRPLPLTAANHAPSADPDYDGDEWYTPEDIIERARRVFGGCIDLDPATNEIAQQVINATDFYTKADDGLNQPWRGKVWLNPPYSMPLIANFVDRVLAAYTAGEIDEAIVLTNNSSDTRWFQSLISNHAVCFPAGRLGFWRNNQQAFAARQGQAIFYLGRNRPRFIEAFAEVGTIAEAI